MSKRNWFNTLNESLESENLIHTWDIHRDGIAYGATAGYTYYDENGRGEYISIYRNSNGMYERPVHYYVGKRKAA